MTDIQSRTREKLRRTGAGCRIKGYEYLVMAVELTYNDPSYRHGVTKRLYPDIAEKYGATSSRVERAMRHYIETAYLKTNKDTMFKIVGQKPDKLTGKLTVSEFIAAFVETLRCEEGKNAL